jgi:hypothetical protein
MLKPRLRFGVYGTFFFGAMLLDASIEPMPSVHTSVDVPMGSVYHSQENMICTLAVGEAGGDALVVELVVVTLKLVDVEPVPPPPGTVSGSCPLHSSVNVHVVVPVVL